MGYTHYWSQSRKFVQAEWTAIRKAVKAITDETDAELCYEYDKEDRAIQIDGQRIRFNGAGDEGHETFIITRSVPAAPEWRAKDDPDFQFCKTARKDYDAPVVACLIAIREIVPDAFEWSSDGWLSEHADGLALANKACGLKLTQSNVDPDDADPEAK